MASREQEITVTAVPDVSLIAAVARTIATHMAALADDLRRLQDAPCCDMHGRNCEPPGDLCCGDCTEARHSMWNDSDGRPRYGHPPGEQCSNPDLSDA